ncbi:MAG: hypothetical protein M8467_05265 [Anaerolineae bacterium]|nr:hypothetical protein [Anaerolineae bacterium]
MKTIAILVLILSLATGLTLAANGVERPREVFGGGSSMSVADGVSFWATLGQPAVARVSSAGGEVTVRQGFWHGSAVAYHIYLPLLFRH